MAKTSQFIWQAKALPSEECIQQFKEETGMSESFATLCLQRGITSKEDLEAFLNPNLEQLHDPFLMYDMQKAVQRIREAIARGERILIYGDYDADGMTSTTILVEAVEMLGGDVHFYLPNRFTDGYGPNKDVFQYMIDVEKTQLIVTCDNGVAGHEAIEWAMDQGVDVIVTDHHELPEHLPQAYAIVHPRHPLGQYPFGDLSGAGVAFKVACALLEDIPLESLDIVAIGTVADLVSLTNENRVLVSYGLNLLKQTQRVGLLKLLESIGVSADNITADTIGFGIAPRLNALGRLDDATPGVELLITFDDEEADKLVELLTQKNNERKHIVDTIVQDIEQKLVYPYPNAIVLADEKWHAGVLGIVASRVVEKTGKPTILLQIDSDTQMAKGSGRSVESVNLYTLLQNHSHLLEKFGGHHMAAGMSISVNNIAQLQEALAREVPDGTQKVLQYDMVISSTDCTLTLIHDIEKLAPFGIDNQRPLVLLEQESITQMKAIGTHAQHLKGVCQTLDIIYFNAQQYIPFLKDGVVADFIARLSINEWNGLERAQAQIVDTRITEVQFFDMRSTQIKPAILEIPQAIYLFSDSKYYDYFSPKIDKSSRAVYYAELSEQDVENVVLFDCPQSLKELECALAKVTCQNVYIQAHTQVSAYLTGIPTRQQFAHLYKILYNKTGFSIKDHLEQLVSMTKLSKEMLILMLQVFVETGVITIEQGLLTYQEVSQKQNLEQTKRFKQHLEKIDIEKILLYTQFSRISEQLKNYVRKEEK
ncbi:MULTISPECIES: single-stranded-DNA-specific exonuclease RecJ [unclassified Granulicatella]|uniref:single-stranded-DNA-specific exonuclease RecJ n=1 Tax=unclassified Granulicatella TaxID=2630493 RepID=UPI0014300367|nr:MULTISPECIES: single-stranded-DNA-specific exonuclease RecJ [unclassified Granulicatella]MBF0780109.1 single-stranded-DNA-specific exonuclease RecJ [Granulicatella sp. 19428wC4_WM01]